MECNIIPLFSRDGLNDSLLIGLSPVTFATGLLPAISLANQRTLSRIQGAFLENPVANQDAPGLSYVTLGPL